MKKWLLIGTLIAAGAGAIFFGSNIFSVNKDRMLLMRQFQVADLQRVGVGPIAVLEPYDAFWYAHSGLLDSTVARLCLTKSGFRYYNVLTLPLPEWVGRGNPWLDWLDRRVIDEWGAYVKDDSLVAARFPAFGRPWIIDWSQINGARIDEFVAKQIEYIGACQHLWLDQYWLAPAYWMFDPAYGVTIDDALTPAERAQWTANVTTYLGRVRQVIGGRSGGTALVNGDRAAPFPIFIENAHWTHWWPWRDSVALWRRDKRNVLSIDPSSVYEDSLLAVWKESRGTIAITGTFGETQAFYLRADRVRRATVTK